MNPHAQPPEAQPSLAQAIAALAGDLRAHADRRAEDWGPIAALHALLLATLARLFGRLETLAHAWQQNLLPPQPPRRRPRQVRDNATPAHAPHARTAPNPRRALTRRHVPSATGQPIRTPRRIPAVRPHILTIATAFSRVHLAPALPPGPYFSRPAPAEMPSHAHFVTVS